MTPKAHQFKCSFSDSTELHSNPPSGSLDVLLTDTFNRTENLSGTEELTVPEGSASKKTMKTASGSRTEED